MSRKTHTLSFSTSSSSGNNEGEMQEVNVDGENRASRPDVDREEEEEETMDGEELNKIHRRLKESDEQMLDEALLTFQATSGPDRQFTRVNLQRTVQQVYIKNGGLPISTSLAFPRDLSLLSDAELVNVAENMILHLNRTKKHAMIGKVVNMIANTLTLASTMMTGVDVGSKLNDALMNDIILKEALVTTAFGQHANPHPIVTIIISTLEHLSNYCVTILQNNIKQTRLPPLNGTSGVVNSGSIQRDDRRNTEEGESNARTS
jgi:hypothetical protein